MRRNRGGGITKALLFPEAILPAEFKAEAPIREAMVPPRRPRQNVAAKVAKVVKAPRLKLAASGSATDAINPRLSRTADTEVGSRMRAALLKYAMSAQKADSIMESDAQNLRREQAQAMLDLFEADRGRAAATLEELKEWACAQNNDQLQFRVDQFLSRSETSAENRSIT